MKKLNILENMWLSGLVTHSKEPEPSFSDEIRILRKALRMTQKQLALRAKITQPHLVGIEKGRVDPQLSTLIRIFDALACPLDMRPSPKKPIKELLETQARIIALKRLKQSTGTMALENQAPTKEVFLQLLEKYTQEILADPREKLWDKNNG